MDAIILTLCDGDMLAPWMGSAGLAVPTSQKGYSKATKDVTKVCEKGVTKFFTSLKFFHMERPK